METRVIFHRDGRLRGIEHVHHSVCGIRHVLKDDGWTVEYYRCGAEWLRDRRAALVLTDTAADYRVVFDLGDSANTTKHWVRLEMIRAAISVGALLDLDDEDDVASAPTAAAQAVRQRERESFAALLDAEGDETETGPGASSPARPAAQTMRSAS